MARSHAVARELSSAGAEVHWLSDQSTSTFLAERSIPAKSIHVLNSATTEGRFGEVELRIEEQEADAALSAQWIRNQGPFDLVLLDTYLLGAAWQRAVRSVVKRLSAFDDLADRLIDADLVINAAAEGHEYERLAPKAKLLFGLHYAATASAPSAPPAFGPPGNMLVAFGASDPQDATSLVLNKLSLLRGRSDDFKAWIQLGSHAPHRRSVEMLSSRLGWAKMLGPGTPIDARTRGISVAIGAAGVSLFERLRDGIPGVVLSLAPNQRRIAQAAVRAGAALSATDADSAASLALELRRQPETLSSMSRRAVKAVDGGGARRIAATIIECCG